MKQLEPLYILDHGIQVIAEYPARGKNAYVRVRIRPHQFFPNAKIVSNGILVRKNRVVLAAKLGRALLSNEHAHHKDENRTNDHPDNIELLTAGDHNREHKHGRKHSLESKAKKSSTMKKLYAQGKLVSTLAHKSGEENPSSKLTLEQVKLIRLDSGTHAEIASKYGVSRRNVGTIKNGVTWK